MKGEWSEDLVREEFELTLLTEEERSSIRSCLAPNFLLLVSRLRLEETREVTKATILAILSMKTCLSTAVIITIIKEIR